MGSQGTLSPTCAVDIARRERRKERRGEKRGGGGGKSKAHKYSKYLQPKGIYCLLVGFYRSRSRCGCLVAKWNVRDYYLGFQFFESWWRNPGGGR